MKLALNFIVLLSTFISFSQTGSISGKVVDENNTPFEFATVAVYDSDELVNGAMTAENGNFIISEIASGSYRIVITFLGYKEVSIENISISASNKDVVVPITKLVPNSETLDEVVITEKRQFVKNRADRKVIQISENLSSAGSSLIDALNKVPSFNVDGAGAISFRGSQNFKVLIDGRPTSLNGPEALQNIPTATIARVEVITNPSARYMADSEVGIINVILKKQYNNGISGQAGFRYDYRNQGNSSKRINANTQLKSDKTRFHFQITATQDTIQLEGPTNVTILNDNYSFSRTRLGNQLLYAKGLNAQAGIDFDLSAKHTLSFWTMLDYGDSKYNALASDKDLENNKLIYGKLDYRNDRVARQYQFTVEDIVNLENGELHFLTDFSISSNNRDNFRDYFTSTSADDTDAMQIDETAFYQKEKRNRWHNEINYSKALNDTSKFEFGILHEYYKRKNTFEEFFYGVSQEDTGVDFRFDIYNLYSTYSGKWKNIDYQLGARLEYSKRNLKTVLNNSLFDIFPSIQLQKSWPNDYRVTLSYSKRIRRPSVRDLSPIILYSDNQVTWRGNPELTDAKVHLTEFGLNKSFEKLTLGIDLFYRYVANSWFRVLESVGENRFENFPLLVANEQNYGMEFTGNWSVSEKIDVNFGGAFYKQNINNKNPLEDLSTHSSRFNLSTNYRINNTLKFQFDANYNGPTLHANSRISAAHFFNLSVQKQFFEKRFTLTLSAQDITGNNVYKQTYNGESQNNGTFKLIESYPSSTKFFSFHLKYAFRDFKKKEVNPNYQLTD